MEPSCFDELTKALATSMSRRQALRRTGGLLGGAVLAGFIPGVAWARNNDCARFCNSVFGGDTPASAQCAMDAAHGKGLCYTCGPASGNTKTICCSKTGDFCSSYSGATCCGSSATCLNGSCCATANVCGSTCLAAPCNASQCLTCDPSSGTCVSTCTSGQICQNGTCVATCLPAGAPCDINNFRQCCAKACIFPGGGPTGHCCELLPNGSIRCV